MAGMVGNSRFVIASVCRATGLLKASFWERQKQLSAEMGLKMLLVDNR